MRVSGGHWVLIDFGLTIKEFDPAITQNWAWGAPEQYFPDSQPSTAADIFALANTLYFALTGRNPYQEYEQLLYSQAVQQFAPRLSEVDADIREFLAPMFNISPKARPSASKLLNNLKIVQGIKSVPSPAEKNIEFWAQLGELIEREAEYMLDFSLELSQAPNVRVQLNLVAENEQFRIGFPSEKIIGKTFSVHGRSILSQLLISMDSQGNYIKRQAINQKDLPSLVVTLVRDAMELSLADLFYKIIR
jgi:serine/threonine protein kinase